MKLSLPDSWPRVAGTLLVAWLAAELCVWLNTPIPWMLGPLLGTSLVSLAGVGTESWVVLRNGGQWVIATALGLYFTPEMGQLVVANGFTIAVGVAWALLMGWGFGAWLRKVHRGRFPGMEEDQWRSTTYFAGAIGAASEMTLISERHGARTDLVASAHTLRVLLVTIVIPFAVQAAGVTGLDHSLPAVREIHSGPLLLLGGLSLLGIGVMLRLKRANPWFIGALFVTIGLTLSGVQLSAVPSWLVAAAQLVIGVSLGVRFTPQFVHSAPRWLASVALASGVMMAASAGFAWLLAQWIHLHPATLVLATSPGGIAEMAITAKVLMLGVPMVTAFQVCRLVAVLVSAEPVFRWWSRRSA